MAYQTRPSRAPCARFGATEGATSKSPTQAALQVPPANKQALLSMFTFQGILGTIFTL